MMKLYKRFCAIGIVLLLFAFAINNVVGEKIVLVTGFEPFGTHETNPSQIIAETLNGSTLHDAKIIGIVLPVDFDKSLGKSIDAITLYQPDLVISLGLAARSNSIMVEKIGVNLKRFPNNDGTWSFPQRIDTNGPFLHVTSFRKDVARKMQQAHIPARQSFFAGLYVCNALFYGLLDFASEQNLDTTIGFIHVPLLETHDTEGMPLETMIDAVTIAIEVHLG